MRLVWIVVFAICLISIGTDTFANKPIPPNAISGRIGEQIQPSDVYARALWLEKEIRLLAKDPMLGAMYEPAYQVDNAHPREVFFLAKSLIGKAQRLSFEHTKSLGGKGILASTYRDKPVYVFKALDQVMVSIWQVKQSMDITQEIQEVPINNATPTDVYNQLLINSRLISVLNSNRVEPSDVIRIVDYTYEVAMALHQELNSGKFFDPRLIDQEAFTDKTPEDVFNHLISLIELLNKYAYKNFQREIMTITKQDVKREIYPSDVIDLASIISAELTFMAHTSFVKVQDVHKKRKEEVTPNNVFKMINNIRSVLEQNI